MTAASLHTVGHGCRVPLPYGVVVVETVALNPLVQGVTHSDNCIQLTQFPKERNGSTEWRKVRAS